MRHPASLAVAFLLLFTPAALVTGCKSTTNHPDGYQGSGLHTPDQAVTEYKQVLAQTCGDKHLDTMSNEQLNKQTTLWFSKLDAPGRGQYGKAVSAACDKSGSGSQLACYNNGILMGAIQDGTLNKLVDQICAPAPQ